MDAHENVGTRPVSDQDSHRLVDGHILGACEHDRVVLLLQQLFEPDRHIECENFFFVLKTTILGPLIHSTMTCINRDHLGTRRSAGCQRWPQQWNQTGVVVDRADMEFAAIERNGLSQENPQSVDLNFATA